MPEALVYLPPAGSSRAQPRFGCQPCREMLAWLLAYTFIDSHGFSIWMASYHWLRTLSPVIVFRVRQLRRQVYYARRFLVIRLKPRKKYRF